VDEFYQTLRKVQKKERNNGTLARVEETFYNEMHEYMDMLKKEAIHDPFSKAPAILKEAQIIATDICQRRETKITNSAVLNIHRSYHLFTGKPQFDLVDTTPLNLTPEEEKFYYSLIDTLKNHRNNISLADFSDDEKTEHTTIIKPIETQTNTLTSGTVEKPADEIIKPKPEPIVKEVEPKDEKPIVKQSNVPQSKPVGDIEDNPNAFDEQDEFYDFESKKVAKDTELVTMLVFDDVGAIVGVDEKVYGPFRPQDIVTLPLINAKIFFKNRKGRQVKI
jgi:DNA replication factor GINS